MKFKGYRKLIIGLVLLMVGLGLEYTIGLSDNFLELVVYLGGAFMVGNGLEHLGQGREGIPFENVQELVDSYDQKTNQLSVTVAKLAEGVVAMKESIDTNSKGLETVSSAASVLLDRTPPKV